MDYGALLTRAYRIVWEHRYLWLLALFAGETSAGVGFNGRFPTTGGGTPAGGRGGRGAGAGQPNLQPALDWVSAHLTLLLMGAVALVVLWIVLFVVSCYCASAIVRAVDVIDGGEEVRLGRAWALGQERVGGVLRLRLLLLLFGLLVAAGIGGTAALVAVSAFLRVWAGLVFGVYALLSLLPLLFVAGVVLPPLLRLALRLVVLGRGRAWASLGEAGRLMWRRPGPVVVLYAVELGAALVLGLVALLVVGVVFVPTVTFALVTRQLVGSVVVGVVLGVVVLVALVVAGSAVAAFLSALWTLAYRRLVAAPA